MKTSLSLVLIVAAASTLAACSSDGDDPRGPTGTAATGGTGTGTGGTGTGGTGTGGTGTGGTGTGGTGTGGTGTVTPGTLGTAFTITADGNVVDTANNTGITGGAILAQSTNMAVTATTAHVDGSLCISGTTEVVPTSADYGTYWGAELALDLKRVPIAGAPAPVADAGADAGAPETEAGPWPYGNVIGFSYKITGKDAAAADKGVPATQFRFKALPSISNSQNDTYCSTRNGLTDGEVDNVLFDDITFECWQMGNPSIGPAEPTINVVDPGPPRVVETPANPKSLLNISWQIASDIPPVTRIPFNFCISDLKPILAP
jgi:hypothetical protein